MGKDIKEKKNLWILIICIIVVALVATALIVFRDDLFKQKKSYNNVIVIERIDGQNSLRIPQQYLDKILMDKSFYIDEIASISMSSVKFEIGEEGIRWGMDQGGLVNTSDEDAMEILGGIKYCKGISV
jgi:cell division protein YceG involved in septum cleavage